jgi:hypothetical protein
MQFLHPFPFVVAGNDRRQFQPGHSLFPRRRKRLALRSGQRSAPHAAAGSNAHARASSNRPCARGRRRRLALKLGDGSLRYLFDDLAKAIPDLKAFAAFRQGGAALRLDEPQQLVATIVGAYRLLAD